MPYITVPTGIEVYYEREGTGPPLVMIMGTGLDHSCWDSQVDAYRRHYECIYFDNRGTGRTGSTADDLSVRLLARDTAGLMDALGIERAHVSGLSMGSCVAQELALARPDLVRTLQLHGTWGRAHGYAARKFRALLRLLELLDLRDFYEINVLWFLTPEYMQMYPDRVIERIQAIVKANPNKEHLLQQYGANLTHDALDRLPLVGAPTLVTVRGFDVALPPMFSREVAEAIPNAELVIFEGAATCTTSSVRTNSTASHSISCESMRRDRDQFDHAPAPHSNA